MNCGYSRLFTVLGKDGDTNVNLRAAHDFKQHLLKVFQEWIFFLFFGGRVTFFPPFFISSRNRSFAIFCFSCKTETDRLPCLALTRSF